MTKFYLLVFIGLIGACASEQPIIYSFDREVQKAIAEGVINQNSIAKAGSYQDIFAVLIDEIEKEIVLNSKVNMPDAIKALVDKTNRYIALGDSLKIPVLFMVDIVSEDAKLRKLPHLPFTGYTIYLDKENKLKRANVQF